MKRARKTRNHRPPTLPIVTRRQLPLQDRLAYDFYFHLQRLLGRLGLTDVLVTASIYNGMPTTVRLELTGRDQTDQAAQPAAGLRKVYSPQEARSAIASRLSRLMRKCNIRFGAVEVSVAADDLKQIDFTESFRPWKEDYSRYFTLDRRSREATASQRAALLQLNGL